MFLSERKLKEVFWKNYNYSKRALRYQFECAIREGNADLVTVEQFQGFIQFNAFEFKLSDIKKAIAQALENSDFVHKSWIVIPIEKKKLIKDRYINKLERIAYVGVITVSDSGRWEMIYKPKFRKDICLSQEILKLMLNERI